MAAAIRGESPPDRGFRKIGQQRKPLGEQDAGTLRAQRLRAERLRAETPHAEALGSWGPEIIVGFALGLAVPVILAVVWAPPPPRAQALFDVVTSVVRNPPQQWGCSGSSSPSACDEWLECAKMQEVARIGEETAEQVIHYHSQQLLSSAVLCNQNFVGACGLWWPEQTELLGPTFSQALLGDESHQVLCRKLLEVVAAGRRIKQRVVSMFAPRGAPTDSPPLISQADLESRAREVLDSEVQKLRQKIDEEGGELSSLQTSSQEQLRMTLRASE